MKYPNQTVSDSIAVDLTNLGVDDRATRNALVLTGGSMLYQTKRGHTAVQLKRKTFEQICRDQKLTVQPALDGLVFVVKEQPKEQPANATH